MIGKGDSPRWINMVIFTKGNKANEGGGRRKSLFSSPAGGIWRRNSVTSVTRQLRKPSRASVFGVFRCVHRRVRSGDSVTVDAGGWRKGQEKMGRLPGKVVLAPIDPDDPR